jgi:hypothetical protein
VQLRRVTGGRVLAWLALLALPACGSGSAPPTTGSPSATVRFVLLTPTTRVPMTPDQATCARFVGPTHIHFSWRNFESMNMNAVPPDRYELTVTGVPTGTPLSMQVADQNGCLEDPNGFFLSNVLANDVALTSVVNVNLGRGLAFTVGQDGRVTP